MGVKSGIATLVGVSLLEAMLLSAPANANVSDNQNNSLTDSTAVVQFHDNNADSAAIYALEGNFERASFFAGKLPDEEVDFFGWIAWRRKNNCCPQNRRKSRGVNPAY